MCGTQEGYIGLGRTVIRCRSPGPRGCTVRCARALRKVGYFRPVSPDGQRDRSNYCVPVCRTAQILTQSNNSEDELNQPMFHTENARLLSESAVLAPWAYAPPVVGGLQGGRRNANLLLGAVPVLCRNAPPRPQ